MVDKVGYALVVTDVFTYFYTQVISGINMGSNCGYHMYVTFYRLGELYCVLHFVGF